MASDTAAMVLAVYWPGQAPIVGRLHLTRRSSSRPILPPV